MQSVMLIRVRDRIHEFFLVSLILDLLLHAVDLMPSIQTWKVDELCIRCGRHDQLCHLVNLVSYLLIHVSRIDTSGNLRN